MSTARIDGGAQGRNPSAPTPRRAPFAAVVVGLFVAGLVGQLLLNTALQHGSFERYTLENQAAALEERRQALDQELGRQEEPGTLALLAKDLGMVSSENPVFLRLADGGVAGTPVAATAPPPPPTTAPPTTAPPGTAPSNTPPATTAAPEVPPPTPPATSSP